MAQYKQPVKGGQRRGGKRGPRRRNRAGRYRQPNPVTDLLTPQQLRKETRAHVRLETRPLERAIKGELRASQQRVGQVGGWWNDYLRQVSGIQGETASAYDNAAAQTQGFIDQSSQIDSANTERLQADAAKSAELRGATPDDSAAQREAAAQAQRNYLSAAYGGATAQQGANQYSYLADQKRIGVGQKIASQREEQRRGLSIRQDLREVAKSKGDIATRYRADQRLADREYLIQRGALGLDKRNAKLDAAKAAQDARDDATKNAIAQQNANAGTKRANQSGRGGRTPSQRRDDRMGAKEAMTAAQTLYASAGRPNWSNKEWTLFIQRVAKEDGIGYAEAKRAVTRLRRRLRKGNTTGYVPGGPKGPAR